MTDKELIKQEIERRYNCEKCYPLDREASVAAAVLQELLLFIDSLPEEPIGKDLEEEVHKHLLNIGATIEMYSGNVMGLDLCEDDYVDFARHFAEWQKNKDLEDSLKSDMTMPNKFYEKGRADMRDELMKDAVEAFVNTYENTDDSNYVEFVTEQSPYKFKETEKCKIIIVKED